MTQCNLLKGPWDADGMTVFYAAPSDGDAITFIEIRANVTEDGWDTVAFIDAAWPASTALANLIKSAPMLLSALEFITDDIAEGVKDFAAWKRVALAAIAEAKDG